MKYILFSLFLSLAIAYNPATGKIEDCIILKINDNAISLWDFQKVAIFDLLEKKVPPTPKNVETQLQKYKDNYINFFLILSELNRIEYYPVDRGSFLRTVKERLKRKGKWYWQYLRLYGLTVTDAASYTLQKLRVNEYYRNFIFQTIKLQDKEIREFYEKNMDRFGYQPFNEVKQRIKNFLILQKRRKKLKEYINRLQETEKIELLFPGLECRKGGKDE